MCQKQIRKWEMQKDLLEHLRGVEGLAATSHDVCLSVGHLHVSISEDEQYLLEHDILPEGKLLLSAVEDMPNL